MSLLVFSWNDGCFFKALCCLLPSFHEKYHLPEPGYPIPPLLQFVTSETLGGHLWYTSIRYVLFWSRCDLTKFGDYEIRGLIGSLVGWLVDVCMVDIGWGSKKMELAQSYPNFGWKCLIFGWWCFVWEGEMVPQGSFLCNGFVGNISEKEIYITFWCLRFELRPSFLDWVILQVRHVVIPTGFWIIFWDIFSSLYQLYQVIHKLQKPFARESNYVLYQLIENQEKIRQKICKVSRPSKGGASKEFSKFQLLKTLVFPENEDSVDAETALVLQNIIKETTLRSFFDQGMRRFIWGVPKIMVPPNHPF